MHTYISIISQHKKVSINYTIEYYFEEFRGHIKALGKLEGLFWILKYNLGRTIEKLHFDISVITGSGVSISIILNIMSL